MISYSLKSNESVFVGDNSARGLRYSLMYKMSVPPVLCTRDVLLEHLYAVIAPLVPGYAEKIVGMLAESSNTQLMSLLGDPHILQKTVSEALLCIKRTEMSPEAVASDSESLGEELFHKVAHLEPNLCAQITGMLLELDATHIRRLLTDEAVLVSAVNKATQEYMARLHHHKVSDHLAEKLYEAVHELYHKNTAKITGMLADLPEDQLTQLLNDPAPFKLMVQMCRDTLEHTQQWIAE